MSTIATRFPLLMTAVLFAGMLVDGASAATPRPLPPYLRSHAAAATPRAASLDWFESARLGLFVHWGVWGRYHTEWAMYHQAIPLDIYQQAARDVDMSAFRASQVVALAHEMEAKYITFVVKHHDGFCLWNSSTTDWDSWDYPMHRDFLRELSDECRRCEMPLFIYYSIGIDWTHPYFLPRSRYAYARPPYPQTPAHFRYRHSEDFSHYRDFCRQQLTELCTNYGDVAGFWFDTLGGVLANDELFDMQEFYDLIHELQPHALIHFKTGATGTEDVLVGERQLESISRHYPGDSPEMQRIRKLSDAAWQRNFAKKAEIAVASQGTWCWTPNSRCCSTDEMWRMLEYAANNNANLLLNFGPMPNGEIPPDVSANFRSLGQRIRRDGFPALNHSDYLRLRSGSAERIQDEALPTAR